MSNSIWQNSASSNRTGDNKFRIMENWIVWIRSVNKLPGIRCDGTWSYSKFPNIKQKIIQSYMAAAVIAIHSYYSSTSIECACIIPYYYYQHECRVLHQLAESRLNNVLSFSLSLAPWICLRSHDAENLKFKELLEQNKIVQLPSVRYSLSRTSYGADRHGMHILSIPSSHGSVLVCAVMNLWMWCYHSRYGIYFLLNCICIQQLTTYYTAWCVHCT